MTFKDLLSDEDVKRLHTAVGNGNYKAPKKVKKEKPSKVEISEEEVTHINEEYLKELAKKFEGK